MRVRPGSRVDAIDQRDGAADDLALRRRGERFSALPTPIVPAVCVAPNSGSNFSR